MIVCLIKIVHILMTKYYLIFNLLIMTKTTKISIIVIVVFLFLLFKIGTQDNTWTKEKEREAIQGCNKWGGEIVRDSNENYLDCAINGQLGI